MSCQAGGGKYQLRFELLWSQLLLCDGANAGELCPGIVSGIIGCTEDYAQRLIWRKLGREGERMMQMEQERKAV